MNAPASSSTDRFPRARTDLVCPECAAPLVLRDSKYGPFYSCSTWHATKCDGSHVAHPDGAPLGVPANRATKDARRRAHQAFDRFWQGCRMQRNDAYRWLAKQMGLEIDDAHIGAFSIEQCDRVVTAVEQTRARGLRG